MYVWNCLLLKKTTEKESADEYNGCWKIRIKNLSRSFQTLEASLLGIRTMQLSETVHSPKETKSLWLYSLKMIFKKYKQKSLWDS